MGWKIGHIRKYQMISFWSGMVFKYRGIIFLFLVTLFIWWILLTRITGSFEWCRICFVFICQLCFNRLIKIETEKIFFSWNSMLETSEFRHINIHQISGPYLTAHCGNILYWIKTWGLLTMLKFRMMRIPKAKLTLAASITDMRRSD